MFEKLAKFAARQLDLDLDQITPDSTFESLGIDSLDVVEMIMDLENELGVELEMEDQKITTFQELADFIESKLTLLADTHHQKIQSFGHLVKGCI